LIVFGALSSLAESEEENGKIKCEIGHSSSTIEWSTKMTPLNPRGTRYNNDDSYLEPGSQVLYGEFLLDLPVDDG
jgi:hypothetical protein